MAETSVLRVDEAFKILGESLSLEAETGVSTAQDLCAAIQASIENGEDIFNVQAIYWQIIVRSCPGLMPPSIVGLSPEGPLYISGLCLSDVCRTTVFLRAIKQEVERLCTAFPTGYIWVLEVGCGGIPILSLWALYVSPRVRIVTIEQSRGAYGSAEKFFRRFGLDSRVTLIHGDATSAAIIRQIEGIQPKYHVLLSETLNAALLFEPIVPIMAALRHLVVPGGSIIPQTVTLQLALVHDWQALMVELLAADKFIPNCSLQVKQGDLVSSCDEILQQMAQIFPGREERISKLYIRQRAVMEGRLCLADSAQLERKERIVFSFATGSWPSEISFTLPGVENLMSGYLVLTLVEVVKGMYLDSDASSITASRLLGRDDDRSVGLLLPVLIPERPNLSRLENPADFFPINLKNPPVCFPSERYKCAMVVYQPGAKGIYCRTEVLPAPTLKPKPG